MSKGNRAALPSAYRGSVAKTQTSSIHVATAGGDLVAVDVYTSLDAIADPELVERLLSDDPSRALHVVTTDDGDQHRISIPLVFHDPAAEVMVLVLPDGHRHHELDERIRLLARLRDDAAPIPTYAKEFAVAYGAVGLRAYLERRAQDALDRGRTADTARSADARARALETRIQELDLRQADLDLRAVEVERRLGELSTAEAEVARARADLRGRVIAMAQAKPILDDDEDEPTSVGQRPATLDGETKPVPRELLSELEASAAADAATDDATQLASGASPDATRIEAAPGAAARAGGRAIAFDEDTTGASVVPQGADPVTTETTELPIDGAAVAPAVTGVALDPRHGVLATLVIDDELGRGFGGSLDLRVLMHRTSAYPIVSLVIGPPTGFRVPAPAQLVVSLLDIGAEADRAVLTALARRCELVVEVVVDGQHLRRVKLTTPLADNVGYLVRAADDHLRALASAAGGATSFAQGCELVRASDFDLLGTQHADAGEFRDDKLAQLTSAQPLRRAIAMARRFARPSREDYLVCTRGFPLTRWRELRRHVLERAVAWGMWMGPELAQVAVSEGLARSRRDLMVRLDRGFEALKRHATGFDIDDEAATDNAKALAEEARALGVELTAADGRRRGDSGGPPTPPPGGNGNGKAIASDEVSAVSGSIGATPANGVQQPRTTDELIALLDDRSKRVAAAIALCDRAEARGAVPVIAAVAKMSRAEAVRVLGLSVKFGDAALQPLIKGLASSKGFLRHGCALALALLRNEQGTQAVVDLLLNEPTEIWREVARAIGQVGPPGLMPLASNFGRLGEQASPQAAERVAWAMAHIAVRGGKAAVETMAGGQSVVAPVARQALELHGSAARDQVRVRPGAEGSQAGRDVTVNRAFSRRFFEALEQGLPDAAQAGLEDLDASGPMEMLDADDLVEDLEDEDEAELDEADLIQT